MKLQSFLFPCIKTTTEEALYFRRNKENTEYTLSDNKIIFDRKAEVSFDTYYNSFSLEKWMKYTNLENLSLVLDLEGDFSLCVSACTYLDGEIMKEDILRRHIAHENKDSAIVCIPNLNYKGIIVFTLTADKDKSIFYGGYYGTEISEKDLNSIRIAIAICTFKREKFVTDNLELLTQEFINKAASPLFGKLEVYVSDNGNTLDYDALNTDFIHVFPNKNLGGAGGFGRCMYEIYKDRENKKYSHILLMDDDVIISPESIYRTYTFLQLIKNDYREIFIGGAMLRFDERHIQYEAAGYYTMMGLVKVKPRYDLKLLEFVVKNEIEETITHFGWYYCVMPISVVNSNNFPLPIFIKRDDIEYGIRSGGNYITLNGISVWHENFKNKKTGFLEYYYWRNVCILNAIHYPKYGKREIKKQLFKKCVKYCLQFRYKDALLCLRGVDDFLKGVDYLKSVDAEKLHQQITEGTYKSQSLENIDSQFIYEDYLNNCRAAKESKFGKYLRYITFNGYFLPAKKTVIVPATGTPTNRLYRARKAIYYEEVSGKAFVTMRSSRMAMEVLSAYIKCCDLINKRYDAVKKEYSDRYKELISIEFWRKYLFPDSNKKV